MIFQQLFDPTSSTYSYILASRVGAEALIIDPVYEHVETYLALFEKLDLRLVKAIDTHIHADHVTGLGVLRDHTRCITVMGERSGADVVSMRVREGDRIKVDGVGLDVLYTPGHTDDSYSFLMDDRVFTGDALLIGGTGRTDFQNGDPLQAYDSLFNKLLKLPGQTLVYPAHDYRGNTVSTIASEKATNPRLQVSSPEEYARIMNNLNLPDPKLMDLAVPANQSIGRSQTEQFSSDELVDATDALDSGAPWIYVDLRETSERDRDGSIIDSIHFPYTSIGDVLSPTSPIAPLLDERPQELVFYCAFGERSALALDLLREKGVHGPRHLVGGFAAWL
ncbi:MAG: MBL fold metallo-hydrolase, partial [Bradymonadaceae bacterium]